MSDTVAHALLASGALRFQPKAPLTFKSGLISPVYVDNRKLQGYPNQWRIVIEAMAQVIAAQVPEVEVVVGVATAGIPHSAALAFHLQKPSAFVRKESKEHGTGQRIEGADVEGRHVVLIEDMVTSGSSSLDAVQALRQQNAIVQFCLTITSYGFARERFVATNVDLRPLADFEQLLDVAIETNYLDEANRPIIEDWLDNPTGWAERHGFI